MGRKPGSLSGLGSRLQQKPAVAASSAVASEPAPPSAESKAGKRSAQPDGRRGILVRARPEAWKGLKLIALDEGMTLQDLMVEAINDVLVKHGKPPIA